MADSRKSFIGNKKAFSSGIPFPSVKLFVTTKEEVEESKTTRKQAKETKQHTHNYFRNKAAEIKHWLETHKDVRKFQRFLLKVGLQEQASDARLGIAQTKAEFSGQLIEEAMNKERELLASRFEQRKQAIASRKAEIKEQKQLGSGR